MGRPGDPGRAGPAAPRGRLRQLHLIISPRTLLRWHAGLGRRQVDLVADLNDEDDEGLGWSTLGEARDPAGIRPGVMLVAGKRQAQAVVRVLAVDDDGQVHFSRLPGSVEKNRHLIGRALA